MIGPRRTALIGCMLLLALSGCVNLSAVQEFGKLSADSAGYTRLTDEYVSAPERMRHYTLESDQSTLAELDKQAAARQAQGARLKAYHKAVADYMKALADLASDNVVAYDPELGELIDSANKASALTEEQAAPLKAVSNLLAHATTDVYRQRKLSEVIEAGNPPLQAILQDLSQLVLAYSLSIEDERMRLDFYYRGLIAQASEPIGIAGSRAAKEPAAAQFIKQIHQERRAAFDERLKAATQYQQTIQVIAQAHQGLYNNRNHLGSAQAVSLIKSYSKQIQTAYKAFRP